jgi:hypothetical protein
MQDEALFRGVSALANLAETLLVRLALERSR